MKSQKEVPNFSLFVLCSGFFSACVTSSIKLTDGTLELGQILFIRYLPLTLISLGILLIKSTGFKPLSIFLTFTRVLSGLLAVGLFTLAAQKLPVATAQALFYCSPLFTAIIFCISSFKQATSAWKKLIPLIFVGLAGVFLINRPHLSSDEILFIVMGFASAGFLSFASLALKALGTIDEPSSRTIFYFSLGCTIFGSLISSYQGTDVIQSFDCRIAWPLIGFTIFQQLTVTIGWMRGLTLLNCVFQFFGVPCAVIIGLMFFQETLSVSETLGLILLISSEIVALWIMKTYKQQH